jgi:hypothetical protein
MYKEIFKITNYNNYVLFIKHNIIFAGFQHFNF